MKILLIEDDKETAAHIVHALCGDGHVIEQCDNGIDGLARSRDGEQSLLIVDRMLPGLDGFSLVTQLRAEYIQTPVLFLTTMSGLEDRVQGLKGGNEGGWSGSSCTRQKVSYDLLDKRLPLTSYELKRRRESRGPLR